jgi:hypothetical protein
VLTRIAHLVALAALVVLLQASDCSALDANNGSGSQAAMCPSSDPLLCPNNQACCSEGNPYECADANGDVQCFPSVPMSGSCSSAVDYCSASGSSEPADSGYLQCAARSQMPLYCDTSVGPQVLQNAPGECCYVGAGATNAIGYICVYGTYDSTGAVCGDEATIADSCPATGTVVKCCYGSAC